MSRLVEYLAVTLLAIGLVFLVVEPIVTKTANSLEASANMIEDATNGR